MLESRDSETVQPFHVYTIIKPQENITVTDE